MDGFRLNDLVEDNEGDKAVVVAVHEDGTIQLLWDCTTTGAPTPRIPVGRFQLTNLSERVRELDAEAREEARS